MTAPTRRLFEATAAHNTEQFTVADWAVFSSVSLIWGASFLLIDIGLDALTPGMITLVRVTGGAVTLLAIASLRSGGFPTPEPAHWRRIAVLA